MNIVTVQRSPFGGGVQDARTYTANLINAALLGLPFRITHEMRDEGINAVNALIDRLASGDELMTLFADEIADVTYDAIYPLLIAQLNDLGGKLTLDRDERVSDAGDAVTVYMFDYEPPPPESPDVSERRPDIPDNPFGEPTDQPSRLPEPRDTSVPRQPRPFIPLPKIPGLSEPRRPVEPQLQREMGEKGDRREQELERRPGVPGIVVERRETPEEQPPGPEDEEEDHEQEPEKESDEQMEEPALEPTDISDALEAIRREIAIQHREDRQAVAGLVGAVNDTLKDSKEGMEIALGGIEEAIRDQTATVSDTLKAVLDAIGETITDVSRSLSDGAAIISDTIGSTLEDLTSPITDIPRQIREGFLLVKDGLGEVIPDWALEKVDNLLITLDEIGSVAEGLFNLSETVWKTTVNTFEQSFNPSDDELVASVCRWVQLMQRIRDECSFFRKEL